MSESLLRVTEIKGRGRSLVSTKPLRAGEVILRESPLLLYSSFPFLSSPYCDHCFRSLPHSPTKCQSCSLVTFCNPTCFTNSNHTPWLCESFHRLHQSSTTLSDEQQVQTRYLLAAYSLSASSPSKFESLLALQGNDEFDGAEFLHSVLSSVCPPLPVSVSVELTAALLVKDKVNGFGLMEPCLSDKRSVRAYGIYPKVSYFNHDCLPNACRFDYVDSGGDGSNNTDIVIRMIHDVPEGREVCLSYFPVNMGYSSRQKRLVEDYGFKCECDRCKVESSWSEGEDDENDDVMEEMEEEDEQEEEMDGSESGNDVVDDSFPHAYFFVRYMCEKENCFGTLAPIPPKGDEVSRVLECNVCGGFKEDEVGGKQ